MPLLVLRGFTVGVFTHAVYTGLIGAAIGWVACSPAGQRLRRTLGAVTVVVAMMAVHGTFNSQDDLTPVTLGVAFLPFVVLLAVIWKTRKSEVAFLAAETARQGRLGRTDSRRDRPDRRPEASRQACPAPAGPRDCLRLGG